MQELQHLLNHIYTANPLLKCSYKSHQAPPQLFIPGIVFLLAYDIHIDLCNQQSLAYLSLVKAQLSLAAVYCSIEPKLGVGLLIKERVTL